MNFWNDMPKPFFALAPMEDVTDVVFRHVILRAGEIAGQNGGDFRPDVFYTEFTNAASFCSEKGEFSTRGRLTFRDEEQPIVAQIWGKNPENFRQMSHALAEKGFAGVDINMGCPVKDVVKSGGGSALMENPQLAVDLIRAAQDGWQDYANSSDTKHFSSQDHLFGRQKASKPPRDDGRGAACLVGEKAEQERSNPSTTWIPDRARNDNTFCNDIRPPISVKTRLGMRNIDEWRPWLTTLLEQNLANLIIHLRTRKEMSKVPAHFELIPEIIKLRNAIAPQTKLTINGDIRDRQHAMEILAQNPVIDGFMVGRGVFANPFCFTDLQNPSREQLFELFHYHLDMFDKYREMAIDPQNKSEDDETYWIPGQARNDNSGILQRKFDPLKRFFKIYVRDFDGAKELREKLFNCKTTDDVRQILRQSSELLNS